MAVRNVGLSPHTGRADAATSLVIDSKIPGDSFHVNASGTVFLDSHAAAHTRDVDAAGAIVDFKIAFHSDNAQLAGSIREPHWAYIREFGFAASILDIERKVLRDFDYEIELHAPIVMAEVPETAAILFRHVRLDVNNISATLGDELDIDKTVSLRCASRTANLNLRDSWSPLYAEASGLGANLNRLCASRIDVGVAGGGVVSENAGVDATDWNEGRGNDESSREAGSGLPRGPS